MIAVFTLMKTPEAEPVISASPALEKVFRSIC